MWQGVCLQSSWDLQAKLFGESRGGCSRLGWDKLPVCPSLFPRLPGCILWLALFPEWKCRIVQRPGCCSRKCPVYLIFYSNFCNERTWGRTPGLAAAGCKTRARRGPWLASRDCQTEAPHARGSAARRIGREVGEAEVEGISVL